MKEKYDKLCSEDDCFNVVEEDDIERGRDGHIYERSKKCWECRTKQDRAAIKRFRKNNRVKVLPTNKK